MKKSLVVLCVCLAVFMCLSSAACLYISALSMNRIKVIQDAMLPEEQDDNREDDVTIAGQYVIRSTKHISEAYLAPERKEELTDKEKETLDMASAVLDKIITDGMSDYEKELAVYEWMIKNLVHDSGMLLVIPTTSEDCDNPYGTLKYHNAVCVGYATTFRMFMEMLGIPCMVVHNTDLFHSWDLVQLNGHWYHTDVYSDAGNIAYAHFNRTDYMQHVDNEWNTQFFPKADSYEFCFAALNAKKETDIYAIPKIVRGMFNDKLRFASLDFGKGLTERDAHIAEEIMNRINAIISDWGNYSNKYISWNWIATDNGFLLCISAVMDGADDLNSFTDEIYEKIDRSVNKSFGDIMYGRG